MADIVGIGILNIDYLVKKSLVKSAVSIPIPGAGQTEHVPTEKIQEIIDSVGVDRFQVFPGGSSFNTVYAISSMDAGISVGYIGISGKEEHGCDFRRIFKENAIDDTWVHYDDKKSNGKCISFTGSDRSLLISSDISHDYEEYLSKNEQSIIDYLQDARIVHLSAIPTGKSPEIIYSILVEARKKNPNLMVSFDPGSAFLQEKNTFLEKTVLISDFLFLNDHEFKEFLQTEDREKTMGKIFNRDRKNSGITVVVKTYDAITVYERLDQQIFRKKYPHVPLPDSMIEDDTGAGDVFSGAFLCARLLPVLRGNEELGVNLSMNLVFRKLRSFGNKNYHEFATVYREFVGKLPERVN